MEPGFNVPPTPSNDARVSRRQRSRRIAWAAAAVSTCLVLEAAARSRGLHAGRLAADAVVGCQFAGAAAMLMGGERRRAVVTSPGLRPMLAGALAVAACLAWPGAAPAMGALARLAVYAGLLGLFARSLRPGQVPVATRLAARIHCVLTPRRIAYTRGVTWLWTAFFGFQVATWLLVLAMSPFRALPRFIAWADLPLLALLIAGELAVRAARFRGQPHGSARDMLRAARRRGA